MTTDLARVYRDDPDDDAPAELLAPVFPTEADVDAIAAQLDAAGTLDGLAPRARNRAIAEACDAHAAKLSRDAKRGRVAEQIAEAVEAVAAVFPTEEHADELRRAIPDITDNEFRDVLAAGHSCWLASIATREVVTDLGADQ